MKKGIAVLAFVMLTGLCVVTGSAEENAGYTEKALTVMTEVYGLDPEIARTFQYEVLPVEDEITVYVYPFDDMMDEYFTITYTPDGDLLDAAVPPILDFGAYNREHFEVKEENGFGVVKLINFLTDAERAAYSKEYIPKVNALLRIDPDYYEKDHEILSNFERGALIHYEWTRSVYGVPGEEDITKEEGFEIAKRVLVERFNKPDAEQRAGAMAYFDITDPQRSVWQYTLNSNDKDYLESGRFVVLIDSKTGEVVDAFEYTDDMPLYLLY